MTGVTALYAAKFPEFDGGGFHAGALSVARHAAIAARTGQSTPVNAVNYRKTAQRLFDAQGFHAERQGALLVLPVWELALFTAHAMQLADIDGTQPALSVFDARAADAMRQDMQAIEDAIQSIPRRRGPPR